MDDHLMDMHDMHGPEGVLVAPEWPPWSEYNPDDDSLATGWNNLLQVGNEADGDISGMQDQVRPFIPSPLLSLTSMTSSLCLFVVGHIQPSSCRYFPRQYLHSGLHLTGPQTASSINGAMHARVTLTFRVQRKGTVEVPWGNFSSLLFLLQSRNFSSRLATDDEQNWLWPSNCPCREATC
jgi:hypothetical protein